VLAAMLELAIPLVENPATVRNSGSIVPSRAPVKAAGHVADFIMTSPPARTRRPISRRSSSSLGPRLEAEIGIVP
jgi:hypothetical protein